MFPGIQIEDKEIFKKISNKIYSRLNPNKLAPIDLRKRWVQIDDDIYKSEVLETSEKFYILYTHPVHEYKNKLYISDKEELLLFLKEHINPKRFEGLDLIIASQDLSHITVCNHDGQIFILPKLYNDSIHLTHHP